MANGVNNGNGWKKLIGAMFVPIILSVLAFGVLSEKVQDNERDITAVEQRIESRLNRIELKLDQLLVRE